MDRILACEPTVCGMKYGQLYTCMVLSCNSHLASRSCFFSCPSLPMLLWAVATFYWGPYRGIGPYRNCSPYR